MGFCVTLDLFTYFCANFAFTQYIHKENVCNIKIVQVRLDQKQIARPSIGTL